MRCQRVLLLSVVVTALIMGVRYLGMLKSWELQAFDQLVRLRPDERPDPRLLVVTVTEDDFQLPQQQDRRGSSLSDQALAQVLSQLGQFKPIAIGLDILRYFPASPNQPELATSMRKNNFFAVCRNSERSQDPGSYAPPEVPTERQGFSNVVEDADGILRRHLIAIKPDPTSPCTTPYSFSAQLAFHYLEAEGISPKYTKKGDLQLGKFIFKRLQPHTGGYQKIYAREYQTLLNYRSYQHSPLKIAQQVSLKDVLNGKVKAEQVSGRIVLIGVTATSLHDYFLTPYVNEQGRNQLIPGVIAQAQMVSQMLSAVLDERLLLWVWPQWGEVLWVWGWSVVGGMLVWRFRSPLHLGLAIAASEVCLYGLCFGLLTQSGCWVPLIPSALALVATSTTVAAYTKH